MNREEQKYLIALGNLQNMAIDNTKGSKAVEICTNDIRTYVERLNNIIDELEKILNLMIYQGYYDIPKADYEGTAVQGFMSTGENSEFGIRAKFILDKLNELKGDNK